MKIAQIDEEYLGITSAIGAYFLWGILPIYWKLVNEVPAGEILAHRIVWSFVFMLVILFATNKMTMFISEIRDIAANRQKLLRVLIASLLISVNWFTYIWAVNDNRIIETSLGYYINPLVSVILGIIVLKEKLSFWQSVSFLLAMAGVFNMTLQFGAVPWTALVLACSFGLYGLFKKMVNIGAVTSITLETFFVSPIALIYLTYLGQQGIGVINSSNINILVLLIGGGAVTAVPLLLFASGANRLPLKILGFLQYIAPTIALLIGIFVYHEVFTPVHVVTFGCIWLALLIFSLSRTSLFIRGEAAILRLLPLNSD